jgi:hypothetical protein
MNDAMSSGRARKAESDMENGQQQQVRNLMGSITPSKRPVLIGFQEALHHRQHFQ